MWKTLVDTMVDYSLKRIALESFDCQNSLLHAYIHGESGPRIFRNVNIVGSIQIFICAYHIHN